MSRAEAAHHLAELLARNRQLHELSQQCGERLAELRGWQSERLARTYPDLYEEPRYRKAIEFFLTDLYGTKNWIRRDQDLRRAAPIMARVLPESALRPLTLAIELQVLSQALDLEMIEALPAGSPITNEAYVAAYRKVGDHARRSRQIQLVVEAGHELDAIVHKPLIHAALRLAHGPAHLAGFGELQDFIEIGFLAFREMQGASAFLAVIESRETKLMERLLSAEPAPLETPG